MPGIMSARSLLIASFLALAVPSVGCTHQVTAGSSPAAQSITVVGRGEVRAKPDLARVNLGVESRTATVAEGSRLTNEKIAQVIAAVRGVGVAESDVRTSNYSIYFERFPTPDYGGPVPYPMPQTFVAPAADAVASAPAAAPTIAPAAPPARRGNKGAPAPAAGPSAAPAPAPPPPIAPPSGPAQQGVYRVANTIEITIRDISKVAAVLDAAVATGANEVQGVSFDLDKKAPHEVAVREKAVADARKRAEALAALHGKKLGEVLAVSEVVTDVGHPMYAPMPMMSRDAGFGGAQIAAGELTVSGQLQVVYKFED
jgi:uncharacterized protein YggE